MGADQQRSNRMGGSTQRRRALRRNAPVTGPTVHQLRREARARRARSRSVPAPSPSAARPIEVAPNCELPTPVPIRRSRGTRALKGVIDRTGALVALFLCLPVLLVTALAIKVSSGGRILYRQERIGLDGRSFTFLKFRTMVDGADQLRPQLDHLNDADGCRFKLREDPRVTPIGRTLRKFSLDELPQLVHVLSGHMSLVGPRPPVPSEVADYDAFVSRRLSVKPGLTGLWQVSGRSNLSWSDSIQLDLDYIDNWSIRLDLAILARTLPAVLTGRGAY